MFGTTDRGFLCPGSPITKAGSTGLIDRSAASAESASFDASGVGVLMQDGDPCGGAVISSEPIGDRLHIQACPGSESELTTALLNALTGG